jgi:hypothetical protein
MYEEIMNRDGNNTADLRRRRTILNFVEKFHTAYCRKDIDLFAKAYGDDDLVFTGKELLNADESSVFSFEHGSRRILTVVRCRRTKYLNWAIL